MKKSLLLISLAMASLSIVAQTFPTVSLDTIQRVSPQNLAQGNDLSSLEGDTVTVEGVVTFDPCFYGLSSGSRIGSWIQNPNTTEWGSLHILIENGLLTGYSGTLEDLNDDTQYLDNFVIGNTVRMTGIVSNFSGNTQMILLDVPTQITGIGQAPAAQVITIDSLMQSDGAGGQLIQYETGEKYEGRLVEFQNVTVVDVAPSGQRFFWSVQDGNGNQIPIRDVSGFFRNDARDDHCNGFGSGISVTPTTFNPPSVGSFLSYIRGIVLEYNGEYYLAPRTPADVGPLVAAPPVVSDIKRNPTVATSSQNVEIDAKVIDPDGTITSASIFYSIGKGNTSFTELPMTDQGNDRFTATLPPSGGDGVYVNYWIRAIDNSNDTTNFPAVNSTNEFYITLDNGIDQISDIQYTESAGGGSYWAGDSIPSMSITGVVTASINTYDLGLVTVQDGTGPWSGIMLQKAPGDGLENLQRGDSVEITSARIFEEFGVTYLGDVNYTLLGKGTVPAPVNTLHPDSIDQGVLLQAEAYESMLIEFQNAVVSDTNPDGNSNFGEWEINIDPQATSGLRVDDYAEDVPYLFNVDSLSAGQQLGYIRGILWFSFGNEKLLPRNQADIDGFSTDYPKRITTFAFVGLTPPVFMDIDDAAGTITTPAPLPAGTDVSALVPTIDFTGASVNPPSGQAQDFTNPVQYEVTAPIDESTKSYTVTVDVIVGIDEPSKVNATIYPNPAQDQLSIILNEPTAGTVYITLTDMTGRIVNRLTAANTGQLGHYPLNLSQVAAGNYILSIEIDDKTLSQQVQVVK